MPKAVILFVIGALLLLAACEAAAPPEIRDKPCESDVECSWCEGDFVEVAECDSRACDSKSHQTTDCNRVVQEEYGKAVKGTCAMQGGKAVCIQAPGAAPAPGPGTQSLEEVVPCTKEGYCFPACSADGTTLTRYKCRRDTCFPTERVNCWDEYQVSCIETYVTLHGKRMTDEQGNPLLTGYCYGHPEKLG